MKKLVIMLMLLFSVSLCSCSGTVSEEVNNQEFGTVDVDTNKFDVIDYYDCSFYGDRVYYVYDKAIKVEYIIVIYKGGYAGGMGITPRYNAECSLKLHTEEYV